MVRITGKGHMHSQNLSRILEEKIDKQVLWRWLGTYTHETASVNIDLNSTINVVT